MSQESRRRKPSRHPIDHAPWRLGGSPGGSRPPAQHMATRTPRSPLPCQLPGCGSWLCFLACLNSPHDALHYWYASTSSALGTQLIELRCPRHSAAPRDARRRCRPSTLPLLILRWGLGKSHSSPTPSTNGKSSSRQKRPQHPRSPTCNSVIDQATSSNGTWLAGPSR